VWCRIACCRYVLYHYFTFGGIKVFMSILCGAASPAAVMSWCSGCLRLLLPAPPLSLSYLPIKRSSTVVYPSCVFSLWHEIGKDVFWNLHHSMVAGSQAYAFETPAKSKSKGAQVHTNVEQYEGQHERYGPSGLSAL